MDTLEIYVYDCANYLTKLKFYHKLRLEMSDKNYYPPKAKGMVPRGKGTFLSSLNHPPFRK